MNEDKYYILTQPSLRGMGSDSDYALVTGKNLHKIMSEEEIESKLKECSTYDEIPDLIALPHDIPISIENMHMENVIFRVHNQWRFARDIIVGDASFTRYFVDLSDYDGNLGRWFSKKDVYEFTSFDFKRTIENHFFLFYKAEDLIRCQKDKIERFSRRDDLNMEIVKDAEATIKRFENLPKLKDEYYEHFYHQKYSEYRDFMNEIVDDEIKRDDVDHTQCAYGRCLIPYKFACEIGQHEELPHDFRYDELFVRGSDIKHLIADLVGNREDLGGFENPQINLALLTVFGYD
ncbi:MAG: hypothetical protein K6E62_11510 [Lachnospiraceae bacterium]|nr:hypothetical protein [Lachnospiraceae bacterium]